MKGMLHGYTKREDGLYYKTVHFGVKGFCEEILVRNTKGRLVGVIRNPGALGALRRWGKSPKLNDCLTPLR